MLIGVCGIGQHEHTFPRQWSKTKSAKDTTDGFHKFLGPQIKARHVYTDCSLEFEKAIADYGMSHDTSTPHRPQTNGVAERAVRRVKEGTSFAFEQSGLYDVWWPEAMACYCFLRNIDDLYLTGDQTAYLRRFGVPFE